MSESVASYAQVLKRNLIASFYPRNPGIPDAYVHVPTLPGVKAVLRGVYLLSPVWYICN